MRIVNFSDARNGLKSVCDQVIDDAEPVVVARRDAPNVVVMSQEYYDSMQETLYLLSSPKNAARLRESIAQARQGNTKRHELREPVTEDEEHRVHP